MGDETAIVTVRVPVSQREGTKADLAHKVRACLNGNRSNAYFHDRDIDILRIERDDWGADL